MHILVYADMRSTKRSMFQQKNSKSIAVVVKSVLDSNCKRFRDTAMRDNFTLKPET